MAENFISGVMAGKGEKKEAGTKLGAFRQNVNTAAPPSQLAGSLGAVDSRIE
jgi:hypothetical protein